MTDSTAGSSNSGGSVHHNPWAPAGWDDDEPFMTPDPRADDLADSSPLPVKVSRTANPEFFQPQAPPANDEFFTEIQNATSAAVTPSEATATTMASTTPAPAHDDMTVVSVISFDVSHIREPLHFLPLEETAPQSVPFAELVARGKNNVTALLADAAAAAARATEVSAPAAVTDSVPTGTSTLTTPSQFGVSDSFAVIRDRDDSVQVLPTTQWTLIADGAPVRTLSIVHGHILGRTPSHTSGKESDLLLGIEDDTGTVSRTHARLDFVDGAWVVTDLNSTNGVLVFDPVLGERELGSGESATVTGKFLLGDRELMIAEEPLGE